MIKKALILISILFATATISVAQAVIFNFNMGIKINADDTKTALNSPSKVIIVNKEYVTVYMEKNDSVEGFFISGKIQAIDKIDGIIMTKVHDQTKGDFMLTKESEGNNIYVFKILYGKDLENLIMFRTGY